MRLKNIAIAILICLPHITRSQTISDIGKITLGVRFLDSATQETKDLEPILKNKLITFAAQSGCSSFGDNAFFISPNLVVNSVDIAEGGMKNVYVVRGELYLSIQDDKNGTIYSSASYPFKGSATKKEAALKNAVLNINYNKVQDTFAEARNKILAYYNEKKDAIFSYADMCVANGDYDEAITCLMMIPEELDNLHIQAVEKAQHILNMKNEAVRQQQLAETYNSNEGIIKEASSLLAMHDTQNALKVLEDYRSMDSLQDTQYSALLKKAENLVSQAEREALRNKERAYRDNKEREMREWKEYTAQTAHERNMDNKNMKLKSQAISSAERVAHHQINAEEQTISAAERIAHHRADIDSQKIIALKNIACEYIRKNPGSYFRIKF